MAVLAAVCVSPWWGAARAAAGPGLPLSVAGQATARLVVADAPALPEQTAARELATYLRKATGAAFEPRAESTAGAPGAAIYLGATQFAAQHGLDGGRMGPEEFVLRTVEGHLVIVGGRPRGTLYGVYAFLEQVVGCRWLTFFGDEFVPPRPDITVPPLDRRERPAFATRDLYCPIWCSADTKRQFTVRNRLNGNSSLTTAEYGDSPTRFVGPGVHTFADYIPPQQYFATHPEYFSMRDGKRLADGGQLCFTNPELQKVLAERVLAQVAGAQDADPVTRIYSVSVNDVPGMCDCPQCTALAREEGSGAAPLLQLVNAVAERVGRDYPQVLIDTLAYRRKDTETPPRTLRPRDNVLIRFCPIDNNFGAPFEDEANRESLDHLRGWSAISRQVWLWYYAVTYGNGNCSPLANLNRWAQDLRVTQASGVSGVFAQADSGQAQMHDLADLKQWVLARLLWDPQQSLDELVADFCDHYYGAASGVVQEYVRLLEEQGRQARPYLMWNPFLTDYTYLTGEFLWASQTLFDRAEAAVTASPEHLTRVRRARLSTDYASLVFFDRLQEACRTHGTVVAMADVAGRYRQTWSATVEARLDPGRQAAAKEDVDTWLRVWGTERPCKPLPPPLDRLPAATVRQVTSEFFGLWQTERVADPAAATGWAAQRDTGGELPLTCGVYDTPNALFVKNIQIPAADVQGPGYGLYPVGRFRIGPGFYVWVTASWGISIPVGFAYNPGQPGREWDIYLSLSLQGPAYPHGGTAGKNTVAVDRLILVSVGEKQ
jgi:hypothetical protein